MRLIIKRIILLIVFVVGGGYVGLIGFLVLAPVIKDHVTRTRFDPIAWRDSTGVPSQAKRIRMVDDLLRKHDFHGSTADDVVKMLGPADDTGYFSEWDLVYWLGPERSTFSIDSEWLVFYVDEHGEVREYRLVTD